MTTSWMQKLRDARTVEPDIVQETLDAFLDHFKDQSVWTNRMVPLSLRGHLGPMPSIRVIKGPDDVRALMHVHYALAERLIIIRANTFFGFLRTYDPQLTEHSFMSELRTRFKTSDHKGRMFRGTPWQDISRMWRFFAIKAPPDSSLEKRLRVE